MYRNSPAGPEFFLVHPGGPFWKNKDTGAWSIPKGEFIDGEDPLTAAQREFEEETGITPTPPYTPLGSVTYKSGKVIHGLRVYGGNGDLGTVCTQHEVDEVVISSLKMTEERVAEVLQTCADRQITVKRMRITMEELNVRKGL